MSKSEKTPMEKFGELVLIAIFFVPIYLVISIYYGWAISVLWGWFISPKFNLPTLSIIEGAGISLAICVIIFQPENYEISWRRFFGFPILAVFCGWLLRLFM